MTTILALASNDISVSNSDGTLTISPTTGAVIASINLGNPNIWTNTQTFAGLLTTTAGSNFTIQTVANKNFSVKQSGGVVVFNISDSSGSWGFFAKCTSYANVTPAGWGLPAIYGADLRTGITTADGSAVTLYAVTASGGVFDIEGSFTVTAYTSGTITYTITWTDENSSNHTLTGSLTATGHVDFTPVTVRAKASTNITAQITGVFVGTVSPIAIVKQVG